MAERNTSTRFLRYIVAIIIIAVFIMPIYFTISVSFSSRTRIEEGAIIPDFTLRNWLEMTKGYWAVGIRNSVINSALAMIVSLVLSIPAAYVFSRVRFMADKHFFFWLLTNRMAPPVVLAIPYLMIWRGLGIWDTVPGIVLAYMVFDIPVTIWILTSFMAAIPREIDEAAFIDGYSLGRYFMKIFLPLLKPAIAVAAFFAWLFSWTEMFLASVLTSVQAKPLTAQLLTTLGKVGYGVEYGPAAAAGVITIIPGLALLYWARMYLGKGFTFGRV